MIPPCILTSTGRYFYFDKPDPQTVDIQDIATALSRICRFTGHTHQPYSVAQHSVYVSYLVPKEYALQGLLHDAAEAYLGDVSSPLKQMLPEYKVIERHVEQAICVRFGLPFPLHPSIKQADLRMLVTEKRDLMPKPTAVRYLGEDAVAWSSLNSIQPTDFPIYPVDSITAYYSFLNRYNELTY